MKIIIVLIVLCAGCAQPISDKAAEAMITRCKELGMATRIFNGLASVAECVDVKK